MYWVVNGSGNASDIVVQTAADATSKEHHERIAIGAIVKELQRTGARMQYQKIFGNGPEFGWVSLVEMRFVARSFSDDEVLIKMGRYSPDTEVQQGLTPDAKHLPSNKSDGKNKQQDMYWIVTGSKKSNGLMVRAAAATSSKEYRQRLAVGAIVKELERIGTRMRYQQVSGDGPESGWVSLLVRDSNLLVPYEGQID